MTKNGEGDLVVMDITAFSRRESMLRLRETLFAVEEDRLAGKKGLNADNRSSEIFRELTRTEFMALRPGDNK